MGLQMSRVRMYVELQFGIEIPDSDLATWFTVGDAYEMICDRLRLGPIPPGDLARMPVAGFEAEVRSPGASAPSESERGMAVPPFDYAFERLRVLLADFTGVAPDAIGPDTPLDELVPAGLRPTTWQALRAELGAPRFLRPFVSCVEAVVLFPAYVLVYFLIYGTIGAIAQSQFGLGSEWTWAVAVGILLAMVGGIALMARHHRLRMAADCATMRTLAHALVRHERSLVEAWWRRQEGTSGFRRGGLFDFGGPDRFVRHTPRSVWRSVQRIVAEVLRCEPSQVTPDARWDEDLHAT